MTHQHKREDIKTPSLSLSLSLSLSQHAYLKHFLLTLHSLHTTNKNYANSSPFVDFEHVFYL